jgi:hypothetical protein
MLSQLRTSEFLAKAMATPKTEGIYKMREKLVPLNFKVKQKVEQTLYRAGQVLRSSGG